MSILIADDDRVLVTMLSARLRKAGFSVVAAFDSMQTMMAVRREEPQAILLDINMPGGGGLDVLRRIKNSANTNHIPVVIITATRTPENEAATRDLGVETWFDKPIDVDALCEHLSRLTGKSGNGSVA